MKKVLYLGTDSTYFAQNCKESIEIIHYPVIKIVPRLVTDPQVRFAISQLKEFTHLLFTSKNTVMIFDSYLTELGIPHRDMARSTIFAIGKVTALHLARVGLNPHAIACQETQEGMVQLLENQKIVWRDAFFFLPSSSISRPVIRKYLEAKGARYLTCALYDTCQHMLLPLVDLKTIDEIVFTSPSTVHAFFDLFPNVPFGIVLTAIGPITYDALQHVKTCAENTVTSDVREDSKRCFLKNANRIVLQ